MTEARLQEIRAAAEAAYPGTWEWDPNNLWISVQDEDDGGTIVLELAEEPSAGNLRFILGARTAVPELLDEVARLRVLYEAMREAARAVHSRTQTRLETLFRNLTHAGGGSLDGLTTRDVLGLLETYGIADSGTADRVLAEVEAQGTAMGVDREFYCVNAAEGPRVEEVIVDGAPAGLRHVAFSQHVHDALAQKPESPHVEEEGVELAGSAVAARANLERFAPRVAEEWGPVRVLSAAAYDALVKAAEAGGWRSDADGSVLWHVSTGSPEKEADVPVEDLPPDERFNLGYITYGEMIRLEKEEDGFRAMQPQSLAVAARKARRDRRPEGSQP